VSALSGLLIALGLALVVTECWPWPLVAFALLRLVTYCMRSPVGRPQDGV
jgi:hypothetical protein